MQHASGITLEFSTAALYADFVRALERVSEYRLKVAQAREIWILVRYPKFDLTEKGWTQRIVGDLPPVLNSAAAASGPGQSWELFVPGRPATLRTAFRK